MNAAFAQASISYRPEAIQSRSAYAVHNLLRQALEELVEVERALATSQTELEPTRRQISNLLKTISRVGSKLLGLEQEVAQMRHFAYHDELTGLPNRSLLLDRLDQTLAQAARRNRQAALLMLDLDGFKRVNDRFGHAIGDQLLQRVAQRLLASTRRADTAARYGGDEFVILLPDVEGEKGAREVAQKIHVRLIEPFVLSGHSIAVTACIGVAVYPGDGSTPDVLIERADQSMYLAKDRAKPAGTDLRISSRSVHAGAPREAVIARRSARQARTGLGQVGEPI